MNISPADLSQTIAYHRRRALHWQCRALAALRGETGTSPIADYLWAAIRQRRIIVKIRKKYAVVDDVPEKKPTMEQRSLFEI